MLEVFFINIIESQVSLSSDYSYSEQINRDSAVLTLLLRQILRVLDFVSDEEVFLQARLVEVALFTTTK